MTKRPLYHQREEIVRTLRRLPNLWARDLAARVDAQLAADERRAGTAHKGPQTYSAELRRRLVAAVEQVPRLLHEASCAEVVLDRIRRAGPEAFGLKREPDIESVRRAVDEVRLKFPRLPVTETRAFVASHAPPRITSFSTTTATT